MLNTIGTGDGASPHRPPRSPLPRPEEAISGSYMAPLVLGESPVKATRTASTRSDRRSLYVEDGEVNFGGVPVGQTATVKVRGGG